MMDDAAELHIQMAGANARAAGLSHLSSPYLKRENMPVVTGEPIEVWHRKEELWQLGWSMEDLMAKD